MVDNDSSIVDLDSLNPKLRLKEYKTTMKDIKAKDIDTKMLAIIKFNNDCRYLTEGGCFPLYIESILPKKKGYDISKVVLEEFLKFAESSNPKIGGNDAIQAALKATLIDKGNINILEIISNLIVFKEEIKKPKPKKLKKGEEPPPEEPIIENELVVWLRLNTLKALNIITMALIPPNNEDKELLNAFANIPNMLENLLKAVEGIFERYNDDNLKEGCLQEGVWILSILVVVLNWSSIDQRSIAISSSLLSMLTILAKESCFTLQSLQLFDVLCTQPDGLLKISEIDNVSLILEIMENATTLYTEASAAAAAPAGGKGAPAKKEPPKKGAPDPTPEPVEDTKMKGSPLKLALCYIKLISTTLSTIAKDNKSIFDESIITRIVQSMSKVMLNSIAWENSRQIEKPFDIQVVDYVPSCCVLFALLSLTSTDMRKIACKTGAVDTLYSTLCQSSTIVGPSPEGEPSVELDNIIKKWKKTITDLRRLSAQAILSLLTEKITEDVVVEDTEVVAVKGNGYRWKSCSGYITDTSLFGEFVNPLLLTNNLVVPGDLDLENRIVRILCAVLQGVSDPVAFLADIKIDGQVTTKISNFCQKRNELLLASIDNAEASSKLEQEEAQPSEEVVENVTVNESVDPLIPSEQEALYMSLIILEILLNANSENINIFTTKERCSGLSDLLYKCGPSMQRTDILEYVVELSDPRRFSYYPMAEEISTKDKVLLRPLICDVLNHVASADNKYRTFNGDLPVNPCDPLPPCDSVCLESVLIVAKIVSDSCCSTILAEVKYDICDSNIIPKPVDSIKLDQSVLDSALRLLGSIATSGARGIYGILESVAETAFMNNKEGAMSGFKTFLSGQCESAEESIPGLSSPFTWSRTQFFDEVFQQPTIYTSLDNIKAAPVLWPYLVISSSLLGVLANPKFSSESASLAILAMKNLCQVAELPDFAQSTVSDMFSAVLLSLGAMTTLSGAIGRFGTINEANKTIGLDFAQYIVQRGPRRQKVWNEYALSKAEEAPAVDPKTGKPIAKAPPAKAPPGKADPKAAKGAAPPVASLVADVTYNIEPDGQAEDPNHGPNCALWTCLLQVKCDDLHSMASKSTSLCSAIQGGLSDVAIKIINVNVDTNITDSNGLTPLMYALVLGDNIVIEELIKFGADFNALDLERNPIIKFGCLSLNANDISRVLACGKDKSIYSDNTIENPISLYGSPSCIESIINTNVDILVSDRNGNSPILCCLGRLGKFSVVIGGYNLEIINSSFSDGQDRSSTHATIEKLLNAGADVNFCNIDGITPIHMAAGRGDIDIINLLVKYGAYPNALDNEGYTPLHYLVAGCPPNVNEVYDILMNYCIDKPFEEMIYNDKRTGESIATKYKVDVEASVSSILHEAVTPCSISKKRLQMKDLQSVRSKDGINLLQLTMCAHVLGFKRFDEIICGDKDARLILANQILTKVNNPDLLMDIISNKDSYNMTVFHSATLLLKGIAPRTELTDKQKRNKRIKYYESTELELLDWIFKKGSIDVNELCLRDIPSLQITSGWPSLLAVILNDNLELLTTLIKDHNVNVGNYPYVAAIANVDPSIIGTDMIEKIVSISASSREATVFLNSCTTPYNIRPIHLALRNKNYSLLQLLVSSPQVNLNIVDEISGMTVLHEACEKNDGTAIGIICDAKDRLDLLVENTSQTTVVDYAINTLNSSLLSTFIDIRANDVIERVLSNKNIKDDLTLLMQLETQNMVMAQEAIIAQAPDDDIIIDIENSGPDNQIVDELNDSIASLDLNKTIVKYILVDDEKKINKMRKHDQIMKLILLSIQSLGLLTPNDHTHTCYYNGSTYSEFLLGYDNNEPIEIQ